jgi:amidase
MVRTIRRDEFVYEMSAANEPAAVIEPGEAVKFFTEDAYSGTIRTTRDRYPKSMTGRGNPATGPVFVKGARAGDVLAIDVVSVRPVGRATMFTGPGKGPLGHKLRGDETVKAAIRRGAVEVDGRRIRMKPMIGVIGVAPRGKAIDTTYPGEHGGNMDCNVITAGARVYLPVFVDGALLALGDVHAAQAAGEVAICAAETRGEVVIRARVVRNKMVTPAVLTKEDIFVIASARTLDGAETFVLDKAYRYLTDVRGMGAHEAVRFMSLACDMEICQVVDPLKTLRVRIPKAYLK